MKIKSNRDQRIERSLKKLPRLKIYPDNVKGELRKILELLIDEIWEETNSESAKHAYNHRIEIENDLIRNKKIHGDIKKPFWNGETSKIDFLIEVQGAIPKEYRSTLLLFWGEGSSVGAHYVKGNSITGMDNADQMVTMMFEIVEWYFYNYKRMPHEDVNIDEVKQDYFRDPRTIATDEELKATKEKVDKKEKTDSKENLPFLGKRTLRVFYSLILAIVLSVLAILLHKSNTQNDKTVIQSGESAKYYDNSIDNSTTSHP